MVIFRAIAPAFVVLQRVPASTAGIGNQAGLPGLTGTSMTDNGDSGDPTFVETVRMFWPLT